MNTVKKGDIYESRSYDMILKALNSGQLGLIADQCRIFKKKGYYSARRKSDIIFDLTLEVWPPGSTRYTLLYIIECKNLSHKVRVDDVEEFHNKISQIAITGVHPKGVFVTNQGFQKGAYNMGESTGMMLIQLNYDDSYNILLHKIHRPRFIDEPDAYLSWDDAIQALLTTAFNEHSKVEGLRQLSSNEIEQKAKELINEFNPNISNYFKPVPFDELILYLEKKYGLRTHCNEPLGTDSNGHEILGSYKREEKRILIDPSIFGTLRFPFVFAHELGHFILHCNLKMNQKVYDTFSDSKFNFRLGKHTLENDKQWIEWQANKFAAALILPEISLKARVLWYQDKEGIRNKGTIYVDHQPVNQIDFNNIVTFLSGFFCVTKTSIIYRLKDIGVLTYATDTYKQLGNIDIY